MLGSYLFGFLYDPAIVNVVGIAGGATSAFSAAPLTNPATFASGNTPFAASQPNPSAPSGFLSIARITLVVVGQPATFSALNINVQALNNGAAQPLPASVFPSSVVVGFNPNGDPDGDGLRNQDELLAGTNPNNADTDGDGLTDGFEVRGGLNPLDNGTLNVNNGPNGDPDGQRVLIFELRNEKLQEIALTQRIALWRCFFLERQLLEYAVGYPESIDILHGFAFRNAWFGCG